MIAGKGSDVVAERRKSWNVGIERSNTVKISRPITVAELRRHTLKQHTEGVRISALNNLSWVIDLLFCESAKRDETSGKNYVTKHIVIEEEIKGANESAT